MTKKINALSILFFFYSFSLNCSESYEDKPFNPFEIIDALTPENPYLYTDLLLKMNNNRRRDYQFQWAEVQLVLLEELLDHLDSAISPENVNKTIEDLFKKTPAICDKIYMSYLNSYSHKSSNLTYAGHSSRSISALEKKPLEVFLEIAHSIEERMLESEILFSKHSFTQRFDTNCMALKFKVKSLITKTLSMGCDPNLYKASSPLKTALYLHYDNGEIAEELLSHSANPNPRLQNEYDVPVYYVAAKTLNRERTNLFKFLLDHADTSNQEQLDKALGKACNPEIAKLLIDKGANPTEALEKHACAELIMCRTPVIEVHFRPNREVLDLLRTVTKPKDK